MTFPLQDIDTNVTSNVKDKGKRWACFKECEETSIDLSNVIHSLQSDHVPVVTCAFKTIENNLCSDEILPELIDLDGPSATLSAMQKHPDEKEIQLLGMALLSEFIKEDTYCVLSVGMHKNRRTVIRSIVIENIVAAMKRFHLDKELVNKGMTVLAIVSQNNCVWVKRAFVLANAIESTVASMKHYRFDKHLVYNGLEILANLSNKIGADIVVNQLDAVSFRVDVTTESPYAENIITMGLSLLEGIVESRSSEESFLQLAPLKARIAIVFEGNFNDDIIFQAIEIMSTLMHSQGLRHSRVT